MFGLFQYMVEMLYLYKTSKMYIIHIILMGVVLGIHIYFFFKQRQIISKQNNPKQPNYSQKIQYVDYQRYVKNNTAKQLAQLQSKPQFARYMKLRQDPNSRYFAGDRNYDDVQEIVFSDQQEEDFKIKRI